MQAEIVNDRKSQGAERKYAELAESFSNTVYEQPDSLKPAAEKYKLALQQGPWIVKGGAAEGPFANPKLNAALFSDDAIKNKRNTEALEIAPKTLIAARVLEHKPAALQALDAVKGEIEKRLIREEALKLAQKAGENYLARLDKGEQVDLIWGAGRSISRVNTAGIAPVAIRAVFAGDVAKLPAHAGVALPGGGYALYRTTRVKPYVAGSGDIARTKTLREQYARIVAEEDFTAWLAALRSSYPMEINRAALESKERP